MKRSEKQLEKSFFEKNIVAFNLKSNDEPSSKYCTFFQYSLKGDNIDIIIFMDAYY